MPGDSAGSKWLLTSQCRRPPLDTKARQDPSDYQVLTPCMLISVLLWAPPPCFHSPERISVVPNQFLDHSKYPVIMGVNDGKRCLSCGWAGHPVLQLEVSVPEDRGTYRFESVAYPGWILCTSQESDKPLSITDRTGESAITEFYFKKISG
uniref:Uncharacterized protein n=1 Tax=Pelusios castaneus TaxID=367368 RepID=A0A8C8SBH3_9SAUR